MRSGCAPSAFHITFPVFLSSIHPSVSSPGRRRFLGSWRCTISYDPRTPSTSIGMGIAFLLGAFLPTANAASYTSNPDLSPLARRPWNVPVSPVFTSFGDFNVAIIEGSLGLERNCTVSGSSGRSFLFFSTVPDFQLFSPVFFNCMVNVFSLSGETVMTLLFDESEKLYAATGCVLCLVCLYVTNSLMPKSFPLSHCLCSATGGCSETIMKNS